MACFPRPLGLYVALAALTLAGCGASGTAPIPPQFRTDPAPAERPVPAALDPTDRLTQEALWLQQARPHTHVAWDGAAARTRFDAPAARAGGMPEAGIIFAAGLADLATRVSTAPDGATRRALIAAEPEIVAFFETYRQAWEAGTSSAVLRFAMATCGGSTAAPATCNSWNEVHWGLATQEAVASKLMSLGYHQTASYATDAPGLDYTLGLDGITKAPCPDSVFRRQAIITEYPEGWGYRWQLDLNPEVYSPPLFGNWPFTPGYDLYVYWWHTSYC